MGLRRLSPSRWSNAMRRQMSRARPDDQEPEPPHQNERTAADGGTYFVTFTVRASEKRTRPEPPANPPSGSVTPSFLTVVSGDAFSVP